MQCRRISSDLDRTKIATKAQKFEIDVHSIGTDHVHLEPCSRKIQNQTIAADFLCSLFCRIRRADEKSSLTHNHNNARRLDVSVRPIVHWRGVCLTLSMTLSSQRSTSCSRQMLSASTSGNRLHRAATTSGWASSSRFGRYLFAPSLSDHCFVFASYGHRYPLSSAWTV